MSHHGGLRHVIEHAGEEFKKAVTTAVEQGEQAFNSLSEPAQHAIQDEADALAAQYHEEHPNPDFDDCVTMVAAGVAAAGAKLGASSGPWGAAAGAAIGAGGGVPAARIACRRLTGS